jgi:hypothetical protein
LGLDFLVEMSQNQAPHSNRPSTYGKVRPSYFNRLCGICLPRPA